MAMAAGQGGGRRGRWVPTRWWVAPVGTGEAAPAAGLGGAGRHLQGGARARGGVWRRRSGRGRRGLHTRWRDGSWQRAVEPVAGAVPTGDGAAGEASVAEVMSTAEEDSTDSGSAHGVRPGAGQRSVAWHGIGAGCGRPMRAGSGGRVRRRWRAWPAEVARRVAGRRLGCAAWAGRQRGVAGRGGASAAVRLARLVAVFSRPVWPVARGGFGEACGRDTRWRRRSAWGGREEEQRRKDDKGNREVRLTSRQPCSGTPRVADGVDDRLAVRPRAPSARTHSQRLFVLGSSLIGAAANSNPPCPTEARLVASRRRASRGAAANAHGGGWQW